MEKALTGCNISKIYALGLCETKPIENRRTEMARNYEDRLARVLAYIHDNPKDDLSLDALADVAAMSRFHWHRVYHAMTGETCAQTVRRVRLHRVAAALLKSEVPIAEIAAENGYESTQALSHAFQRSYRLSPSAFRTRGVPLAPLSLKDRKDQIMFDVSLRTQPAQRLGALLHKGPYDEVGVAFEQLGALVTARNLWTSIRGMVGVYYDDPSATAPEDLTSHAGIVLGEGVEMPEGLTEVSLPGGEAAVLTFKGPYAGLQAAYDYLFGVWLPASGREAADVPVSESYLNAPQDTAPDDLLTEIILPLK